MKLKFALKTVAFICSIPFYSNAATIGLFGTYGHDYGNELQDLGNTVLDFNSLPITAENLEGLDTVVLLRNTSSSDALTSWIYNGGTLITEWDSANYAGQLIGANIQSNYSTALTDDSIVFTETAKSLGLTTNIGNSYSAYGGSEYFQDFLNTGSGTILAYRGSNSNIAILGGAYGTGSVYINGYDWADSSFNQTAQLLNAESNISIAAVPEPETYAMLAIGLIALASKSRFKKNNSSFAIA